MRFLLPISACGLVILAGLLLIACGEQKLPYTPPTVAVSSLRVTSTDVITASLPLQIFPSPDGKLMVGQISEGDLCVYDSEGIKQVCGKFAQMIDFGRMQWSPDSRHIAFTEFYQFHLPIMNQSYQDPDIWVMDADSGKLTNLTDDHVNEISISTSEGQKIDVAPTWSREGDQLTFVRYTGASAYSSGAAYTINASGGEVTRQAAVNATMFSGFSMDQSQDGKQLAYYEYRPALSDMSEGGKVWLLDLSTGKSKRMVSAHANFLNGLEFSPDGRYIMAFDISSVATLDWRKAGNYSVDVESGERREIAGGGAQYATWAPSGAGLAYLRN
jgi:tricorn protease-like protein